MSIITRSPFGKAIVVVFVVVDAGASFKRGKSYSGLPLSAACFQLSIGNPSNDDHIVLPMQLADDIDGIKLFLAAA